VLQVRCFIPHYLDATVRMQLPVLFLFKCFAVAATPAINECLLGSHNCDVHATCTDTEESFACQCRSGFTGNGTVCFGEISQVCCTLKHRHLTWIQSSFSCF